MCVCRIRKIYPNTPAAESGLIVEGDVLLEVNGEKVQDLTHQVKMV